MDWIIVRDQKYTYELHTNQRSSNSSSCHHFHCSTFKVCTKLSYLRHFKLSSLGHIIRFKINFTGFNNKFWHHFGFIFDTLELSCARAFLPTHTCTHAHIHTLTYAYTLHTRYALCSSTKTNTDRSICLHMQLYFPNSFISDISLNIIKLQWKFTCEHLQHSASCIIPTIHAGPIHVSCLDTVISSRWLTWNPESLCDWSGIIGIHKRSRVRHRAYHSNPQLDRPWGCIKTSTSIY
jgi:hypothetical protein